MEGDATLRVGEEEPLSTEGLAQSPPSDSSASLRNRKKKSTKLLSYRINNDHDQAYSSTSDDDKKLSSAQESVFLNMNIRKMHRRIRGKQSNDSLCCEFSIVIILLIVMTILGWDDTPQEGDWQKADTVGLVVSLLWLIFALCVFFVWGQGPYAKMLRYMVIYIPLIFIVVSISFFEELRHSHDYWTAGQYPLLVLAILVEVLVFVGFMSYYKFVPKILQSDWLRKKPGLVQRIWNIESIVEGDAWTMSYRAHNPIRQGFMKCKLDYMCKYEGRIDANTGLPDGLGRWLDDSYDGEMLTGYFNEGRPVAPFSSWTVGKAEDAVVAVRVGYFKATDDVLSENKLFPTNDNQPECGVAGVECSVSGNFYKHLPAVSLLEGPYITQSMPNAHTNPIQEMLSHLFQLGSEEDHNTGHQIDIRTDSRGVHVLGHVYQPTGRHHSPDAKSITVDIEWGSTIDNGGKIVGGSPNNRRLSSEASARCLQKALFMPKANSQPLSKLIEVEVEDSSEEEEEESVNEEKGSERTAVVQKQSTQQTSTFRIQNWIPIKYKEALVFCPGYNSCMEASLKNLGQFLAMTKLSGHVYPIVFAWPGSKNVGYKYASQISATKRNEENMLKLVTGLKEAGIDRINFLTHSMGVQTLMHVFRDTFDDEGNFVSRSDVSKCFTLDPNFDDSDIKEGKRQQFQNQLICKSITLLNPDFPVKAFVDRGFLSIRRVCSTVTVVGDMNDRALGWSSLINGAFPYYLGYQQPEALQPTLPKSDPKREFMPRIGRSIHDLYFPDKVGQMHLDSEREDELIRLLFNKSGSIDLSGKAKKGERFWLDIDVIDMTGLDTNIKGMRHSGFSYNGMLLKDLQELFSTGKRAITRSSLIFREGNNFTFAFAPSFVSQ